MNDLESFLFYRHRREEVAPVHRTLAAADGYRLETSVFAPLGAGRGAVVMASGTGVRRGYYAPFARWLASEGFGVVTFDYRGIGDSKATHAVAVDATMKQWGSVTSRAWSAGRARRSATVRCRSSATASAASSSG